MDLFQISMPRELQRKSQPLTIAPMKSISPVPKGISCYFDFSNKKSTKPPLKESFDALLINMVLIGDKILKPYR